MSHLDCHPLCMYTSSLFPRILGRCILYVPSRLSSRVYVHFFPVPSEIRQVHPICPISTVIPCVYTLLPCSLGDQAGASYMSQLDCHPVCIYTSSLFPRRLGRCILHVPSRLSSRVYIHFFPVPSEIRQVHPICPNSTVIPCVYTLLPCSLGDQAGASYMSHLDCHPVCIYTSSLFPRRLDRCILYVPTRLSSRVYIHFFPVPSEMVWDTSRVLNVISVGTVELDRNVTNTKVNIINKISSKFNKICHPSQRNIWQV